MSYQYWLHEKIQVDMSEAFEWYEQKQYGLGHEFLNEIENKIQEIIKHPQAFGSKGNLAFREALINRFPFVIVYKIYEQKKEVFISAIHMTKKSPKKKYRKP